MEKFIMLNQQNPFNIYVTAETMPPELLSRWFSSAILEVSSVRPVTDRANQFVVGTPGSGKTMLLRMLSFAVQRERSTGSNDRPLPLPEEYLAENKQYVGIYFNFDDFRRQAYDDGRLRKHHAVKALEDYVSTRLTLDLLSVLGDDRVMRLKGTSRDLEATAQLIVSLLQRQGIDLNVSKWDDLLNWFRSRLQAHRRFVLQIDETQVPTGLEVVYTPHLIAVAAREMHILPQDCALYVIIDQADSVLGHETGATILKHAILSAARQELPLVFLKVGLRRRSLVDINLSSPMERSIDREMTYIDIDTLTRQGDKEYKNWLLDICRLRLSTSPELEDQLKQAVDETESSEPHNPLSLAFFSPDDEAREIVSGKFNEIRHIQRFCDGWEKLLGVPKHVSSAIGEDVRHVDGPLNQMYVLIQLSKLLRRMIVNSTGKDLREATEYKEAFDLEQLNQRERSRTKWTQPAIFQLIEMYGRHYRKNYAGFDYLADCSERNVSHFIETIGRIIDQAPRNEVNKIILPIPASTQTSVVHSMSEFAWREMLDISTQGALISSLLESIKREYRDFLMLPWLPVLCFSSFDLTIDPENLIAAALTKTSAESVASGELTLGLVLREAMAAGYLRREVKENGRRYRMRINRIFMPRLELPTQSQHGPPVIKVEKLLNFFKVAGSHGDLGFNEVDPLIGARQQPYKQLTLTFPANPSPDKSPTP